MRNVIYLAIVCGALLASSGCGSGGKFAPPPEANTDEAKESGYAQSHRGMNQAVSFTEFLNGLGPADRVKYINKSAEEGPQELYGFQTVYQKFTNDPDPAVAAAAKEALSKVPTKEEFEKLRKEAVENLKKS